MKTAAAASLLAFAAASCVAPPRAPATAGPAAQARAGTPDPALREVPLPGAAAGWRATLVLDRAPTGIWAVRPIAAFSQYGGAQLAACDDEGTLWLLVAYGGKWTPLPVLRDGSWLGGLDQADADPRAPGAEIYVGSRDGNVWQVRTYPHGQRDGRLIAWLPGHEVHTLLAGELDAAHDGPELLAFTSPGALWRLTPDAADGAFRTTKVADLPARVRDAVALPARAGEPPAIAVAARDGAVSLLRLTAAGPNWEEIHRVEQGRGRIALAPGGEVLYSTSEDGRVFRHARGADGAWTTSTIHRGAPGPRGVAVGRFVPDPEVESVAVFGYGAVCELLTRAPGGEWRAEALFTDRDSGHWLCAVEADGRNATAELALCGYGGRVVMLAREP